MKCLYCAEEIQDAAILCRFCGAEKREGVWFPPQALRSASGRPKGTTTMWTAGGFFILGGLISLAFVTAEVPLFGAMRGGAGAIVYNLLFAAVFLGVGGGLILGRPWGYRLFWGATVLYSLDKVLFLADTRAQQAYLAARGVTSDVNALMDPALINQMVFLVTFAGLAGWWGFALYVYLRRGYFHRPA